MANEIRVGKICTKCGEAKGIHEFARHGEGRRPDCKPCRRLVAQAWYRRSKTDHNAKQQAYYRANREKVLERQRQRYVEKKDEIRAYTRRWRLKQYGLTEAGYEARHLWQGGRCAICFDDAPLVIDHDHATDMVRALLCDPCNKVLGMADEDIARLRRAADYLEACHR